MANTLELPQIRKFRIKGYELFPGKAGAGIFEHSFVDGVNLIVGVNGIGKTTLLRMLHRGITGPADLRAADELGQAKREMISLSNVTGQFASRTTDGAKSASITVWFDLGSSKIEITRSLRTLEIQAFKVNGRTVRSDKQIWEDAYQEKIRALVGVASFFDVLMILRYLVFYFEDRKSIVWDSNAQDELTRVFLYPSQQALSYRTAFNVAQEADSAARNYQALHSKEKKAATALLAASEAGQNYAQDKAALQGYEKVLVELRAKRETAETQRRAATHALLSHQSALLELQTKESEVREKVLAECFPALEDFGAFLWTKMQADEKCIVCGSEDRNRLKLAVEKFVTEKTCPCCDSPVFVADHAGRKTSPSSKAALDKITIERAGLRSAIRESEAQLASLLLELRQIAPKLVNTTAEKEQVEARVLAVEQSNKLPKIEERLRFLADAVASHTLRKNEAISTLKGISDKYVKDTKRVIDKISKNFSELISVVLAEKCSLSASIVEAPVGQGASSLKVQVPLFVPMMTGATSPNTMLARRTVDDVSESQRDLIDFAFRLAFLRVLAPNQKMTLCIETPEASLDSVFILRFANLVRDEAGTKSEFAKSFVVTSNLTGTSMIPCMLGIGVEHLQRSRTRRKPLLAKSLGANTKNLLNLIENAAMSAAAKKHLSEYRRDYATATGVQ